jgi:putative acyl-CoA dehydrogenase
VLRAMAREPESAEAFMAECESARGADPRYDAHLDLTRAALEDLGRGDPQFAARALVEDMALALQASLLLRNGPAQVADAFCAARLGGRHRAFGTLPHGVDAAPLVARALAE